jgi:hypothetical protein
MDIDTESLRGYLVDLPPELWGHIIEFASESRSDLCSCALVCHTWNGFTRPLLFKHITLYRMHPLVEALHDGECDPSHPILTKHVKTIHVQGWSRHKCRPHLRPDLPPPSSMEVAASHGKVFSCLRLFTAMTRMEMESLQIDLESAHHSSEYLERIVAVEGLKSVVFDFCKFGKFGDVLRLLGPIKGLKDVVLTRCQFESLIFDSDALHLHLQPPQRLFLKLEALTVDIDPGASGHGRNSVLHAISDWFSSPDFAPSCLCELTINSIGNQAHLSVLQEVLKGRISQSLQYVSLHFLSSKLTELLHSPSSGLKC